MMKISIELQVSFDIAHRKEKEAAMLKSARMAAKHLFSAAVLTCDKGKPDIKLFAGDMIEGESEIELADDF